MKYYRLYGLSISAPIEFPELDECVGIPEVVDAEFSFSEPPEVVKQQYLTEGKFSDIKPDEMWFRLYDEMLVYVKSGREVRIWLLDESIDKARLRTYILSGAVTLLLLQRDYILLHGSAIYLPDKNSAIVVSGPSGSGKSTTAYRLLEAEDMIFASDDISAVKLEGDEAILYPGPPWQRFCPDIAEKIGKDKLTLIPGDKDKYGMNLSDGYITEPVRLSSMYILDKCNCTEPELIREKGEAAFQTLTHNMFRGEMLHMIGMKPQTVFALLQLTSKLEIYTVKRPEIGNSLDKVVTLIRDNCI